MRNDYTLYEEHELAQWYRPRETDLEEAIRGRYSRACAALTAVLTGASGLTRAATDHQLCRKRLRNMVRGASRMAPDGQPYGYRVCVPYGAYQREKDPTEAEMPRTGGPSAMGNFLAAQPAIADWINDFSHALPRGRAPKAFDRLHARIVAELKRLDLHDYYPLNQPDQGRRALLRYMRSRRIDIAPMGDLDTTAPPLSSLAEIFRGSPFSRTEVDAHAIDIEAVLAVRMPNGGIAKRPITRLWLLVEIEVESRAVLGWSLRVGKAYNNLDLSDCIARGMEQWTRRELTIPGLEYAPGAGYPSGLLEDAAAWRARSTALDNAKAHSAIDFEQGHCRAHGGYLIYGKAHAPRSRPIVEQFYSRLERGALRSIPGGFEPATRLGEDKIRISNFSPGDYPIQLHLFEELLEVIIANYNATPHPALGDLSPLQFLQMQPRRAFDFQPDSSNDDAAEMGTRIIRLVVHGDRKTGVLPHVNHMYVRYRSPDLADKWEMVGKAVLARVCRHDLRQIVLLRSATAPMCVVRASPPWDRVRHDETTRGLIMQWTKLRTGFSINGVDCAVAAYVEFLRKIAHDSQAAVDQLARMHQVFDGTPPSSRPPSISSPIRVPRGGWISLDD